MPMGLTNAPATYQRLMEECLGDLHLRICRIYLDDIIIFAKSFDEHQQRLEMVLQRLQECGIKLSPSKCAFCMKRVKYVGHVVSEHGIEPDDDKICKVQEWPTPTKQEEVRKFLGFVGYYRKFIRDFSKIARPLTDLIPSTTRSKTTSKKTTKLPAWTWGPAQEEAFQTLKARLTSPPVLAYPDFTFPFEVHTDASSLGLGAVLYQTENGQQHVIAYASRGLSKSERNYPAHKLEFLALKWAVTEKFHDYLHSKRFTVVTDNNPLTYVLTTAKLDATGHRWVAALAAFDFDVIYRPGRNNIDGDTLSRLPGLQQLNLSTDSVKSICQVQQVHVPYVETLSMNPEVLEPLHPAHSIQTLDIHSAQHEDPIISDWIYFVYSQRMPRSHELPSCPDSTIFRKNFDKFKLKDDLLYRVITIDNDRLDQLVIPPSLVTTVLQYAHDRMGHPGRDKTSSFIRDRFFWPGMSYDIDNWIKGCKPCLLRKTPTTDRAPLVSITTTEPLELVCMDFLQLETSKGGYPYILVITDHFTKYALAIPTRNTTARTTAEAFFNNFIVHYGFPKRIHSDQGPNFESKLIKELCTITGMEKSRTTPYHPMCNGVTERFNRTLLGMLGTLTKEQKSDWKKYLGPLVHAYNSMRQDTTGQTPYFLMFGRQPRLPIDIAFGLRNNSSQRQSMSSYVSKMRDRLQKSYELATKATQKAQQRQKSHYDLRSRGGKVEVDDLVLVKIVAFDGKHKLANKWEEEPYRVLRQPNPDVPVYEVQRESGEGRKRILHRNLLLPLGHLNDLQSLVPKPTPTPRKRKKVSTGVQKDTSSLHVDEPVPDTGRYDSSSDESDSEILVLRPRQKQQTQLTTEEYHRDHLGDDQRDTSGQAQETARDASDTTRDSVDVSSPDTESSTPTSMTDTSQDVNTHDENDGDDVHDDGDDDDGDRDEDASTQEQPVDDTRPERLDTGGRPVPARRSSRQRQAPPWMRDGQFVMNMMCRAMMDAYSYKE